MAKGPQFAVSPTRAEDYAEWYQQVIKLSELAEHSPVRGCMVIKPWGFGLWETIKNFLDKKFKETGHENAYFPLFIPLSYLQKEAEHIEGFAKECAVVTHHKLEKNDKGELVPSGQLEEPLVVRPTSETIIGEMYSKWISSYRDLPLKLNQWANVVRWEMRTRLFLRTAEILWQEGHTAHASKEEALEETLQMLGVYTDLAENQLAIPVICGRKTEREKFPGALETYTFEAMMQDGKALQMGTSHFLGQTFAKSSNIQFSAENGNLEYVWTTSWGVTTRLIGALIMVHADDNGLRLPPKVAPKQIVIVPFVPKNADEQKIYKFCEELKQKLSKVIYNDKPLEVVCDLKDIRSGEKNWGWIKKGVPIRIEVGPKEMENSTVSLFKRTEDPKARVNLSIEELFDQIPGILDDIQNQLYQEAKEKLKKNTVEIHSKEDFYSYFKEEQTGFAVAYFDQDTAIEETIQQDLGVTARCLLLDDNNPEGACLFTGNPTKNRVVFAKAY